MMHVHPSKINAIPMTVIHVKIGSSNIPSSRDENVKSKGSQRRKFKKRKKRQIKVVPYDDNICRNLSTLDKSYQAKIIDKSSRDEFHQIVEETNKRIKLKKCDRLRYPCLLCLVFFVLLLGILFAALLINFLTKSSTTTTRPFGALAKYAIVTASYFYVGASSAADQSDGLVDRQPNGTAFVSTYAPQYVQLELPDVYNITDVCLLVAQYSNGATHHQLFVGPSLNSTQLVSDLNSVTVDKQWINITYTPPLNNVRFLRLNTNSSPSWVSWWKFLVSGV